MRDLSGPLHLSDEAIAAFADDVLTGAARERARRHTAECAECAHAVAVQREAVWALRAAPAPPLPGGLLDRLREVPETTPIRQLPTHVSRDGTAMFAVSAPVAAFVPTSATPHSQRGTGLRRSTLALAAASLAVVGTLAGAAAANDSHTDHGTGHVAQFVTHSVRER